MNYAGNRREETDEDIVWRYPGYICLVWALMVATSAESLYEMQETGVAETESVMRCRGNVYEIPDVTFQ